MKKIKIFLGAYVNFPNAQNVNCDNIARYLDKDKFEVHTMYTSKMPIDKKKYKDAGIILHRLWHRRFIWFWSKLFEMWRANCDVYYLPKREKMDSIFAKKNKKSNKVFLSSIEGVVTETTNNSLEEREFFMQTMDETFAISGCIQESVKKFYGVDMPLLPLGVMDRPDDVYQEKDQVKRVVWVGNIKANKRPMSLVECAKRFPQIEFLMIGDGDMQDDVIKAKEEFCLKNLSLTGRIPNEQVYVHMRNCDLLLMTSEFEGSPKVIQEAALCSLPGIYVNENYTVDYIEDGKNGFAVKNVDEMIEKVQYLLDNPDVYKTMSENAYKTIQSYRWSVLIKKYEEYFEKKLEEKREKSKE